MDYLNMTKMNLYSNHYRAITKMEQDYEDFVAVIPFKESSHVKYSVLYYKSSNYIVMNEYEIEELLLDKGIVKLFWNQEVARFLMKEGFIIDEFIHMRALLTIVDNKPIENKEFIQTIKRYCKENYNICISSSSVMEDEYASRIVYLTKAMLKLFQEALNIIDTKYLRAVLLRELNIQKVLCQIEKNGMKIDTVKLEKKRYIMKKELRKAEGEIYILLSRKISLGSQRELIEVLNNRGVPIITASDDDLKLYINLDPIIAKILLYRKNKKLLNTFDSSFLGMLDENNRIHGRWDSLGTATYRITCQKINLQGIKSEMKEIFCAETGYRLVWGDYKNIELFILAHVSNDKILVEAFNQNLDIHKYTASKLFQIEIDEVTELQRKIGKKVAFGLCYGMGTSALKKELLLSGLDVSEETTKEFKEKFFLEYKGIAEYKEMLKGTNIIESLGGRVWIDNDLPKEIPKRFSYPIQATCAEALKECLIIMKRTLPDDWKIVNTIHDEIVLEVPTKYIDKAKTYLESVMIRGMKKVLKNGSASVELKSNKYWLK